MIDLQKRVQLPFGTIYNLLQKELLASKDYIEENLVKNCI